MQKSEKMMYKSVLTEIIHDSKAIQWHTLTTLYLATTANVNITSWSYFEAYIVHFMFERVKMLSKLQLVGMRGI